MKILRFYFGRGLIALILLCLIFFSIPYFLFISLQNCNQNPKYQPEFLQDDWLNDDDVEDYEIETTTKKVEWQWNPSERFLEMISNMKNQQCIDDAMDLEYKIDMKLFDNWTPLRTECPLKQGQYYVGCYNKSSHFVPDDYYQLRNMSFSYISAHLCADHCYNFGWRFAHVFREMCFCDNIVNSNANLSLTECDLKCRDDMETYCGGFGAFSAYFTGARDFMATEYSSIKEPDVDTVPAKIAFVIFCHGRNWRQIIRLINAIYDHNHYYYIHVDTNAEYLQRVLRKNLRNIANIYLAEGSERIPVEWGSSAIMDMALISFQNLLAIPGWNFDFVLNLSGADYPIKPIDEMAKILGANRGSNFIGVTPYMANFVFRQRIAFVNFYCEDKVWDMGERELPKGVRFYGGSDWFTLSRDFVKYMINALHRDESFMIPLYRFSSSFSMNPSESFIPTALMNSRYCLRVFNHNNRAINWAKPYGCRPDSRFWNGNMAGCSPLSFNSSSFKALSETDQFTFMARKFDSTINQQIMNDIDRHLLFRNVPYGCCFLFLEI